jgi:hypothetical protein
MSQKLNTAIAVIFRIRRMIRGSPILRGTATTLLRTGAQRCRRILGGGRFVRRAITMGNGR